MVASPLDILEQTQKGNRSSIPIYILTILTNGRASNGVVEPDSRISHECLESTLVLEPYGPYASPQKGLFNVYATNSNVKTDPACHHGQDKFFEIQQAVGGKG